MARYAMPMKTKPRQTDLVASLPATVPFIGPENQERARGKPFRARIGANEGCFGPAPSVISAMRDAAPGMWKYCDPDNYDLKVAITTQLGIGPANVVIGEGIDGLLDLIVRIHAAPGDVVVTSLGAYPTFNFHVAGFGAQLQTVAYAHDHEDLDGLLDAVRRADAKLVYLSNPDNPMGTWWNADEVRRFAEALPETTMLALDEAYGETAPSDALPPATWMRPNVVRFRTFSKAYGLAGLRCGYAFGETDVIAAFDKVRNHYGVNRMAQIACLAAMADQTYLGEAVGRIARARNIIAAIGRENGLKPIESATNFVAMDCGGDGAFALKIMQGLLARDVFVRKPSATGLDRCIRVSAGLDHELEIFAEELPRAIAAARA